MFSKDSACRGGRDGFKLVDHKFVSLSGQQDEKALSFTLFIGVADLTFIQKIIPSPETSSHSICRLC